MQQIRFKLRAVILVVLSLALLSGTMAQRTRNLQQDTRFKQIGTSNVMLVFKAGTQVTLNAKNEVLKGILAADTKVSRPGWPDPAVLLKGGTEVVFHPDGSPNKGTLAENANFILYGTMNKRAEFLSGGEIEIDTSFLLITGILASEEILQTASNKTMKFKKGNKLTFNNKGLVEGY